MSVARGPRPWRIVMVRGKYITRWTSGFSTEANAQRDALRTASMRAPKNTASIGWRKFEDRKRDRFGAMPCKSRCPPSNPGGALPTAGHVRGVMRLAARPRRLLLGASFG